jgi:hypothetical protein
MSELGTMVNGKEARMKSVDIIPRRQLFGNSSRYNVQLSPDGMWCSWIAPVNGVMNIWCAAFGNLDTAMPLTELKGQPIAWHAWAGDSKHVLFLRDNHGDENYHVYSVNATERVLVDLTPFGSVNSKVYPLSPDNPNHVVVALNDRDPAWHDVWRIDVGTGERNIIYKNDGAFGSFLVDWQGRLRLGSRMSFDRGGAGMVKI